MNLRDDYFVQNHTERVTSVFLRIVQEDNALCTMNAFGSEEVFDFFKSLGRFFYLVSPSESSFKDPRDVPRYFSDVSTKNTFS